MAVNVKQQVTDEEFMAFVELPENSDKTFELINGEIGEVTSNFTASKIAMLIGAAIIFYLRTHDLGHITGANGGYIINGQHFVPDVAYISYERKPKSNYDSYTPNPPELAVEVISNPTNAEEGRRLRFKISHYLAVGTVVWVVNPTDQTVEVYHPGYFAELVGADDTLTLDEILPEFALPVKSIFPAEQGE